MQQIITFQQKNTDYMLALFLKKKILKMTSMDCDAPCSEPPTKVAKTDLTFDASPKETKVQLLSPEPNIVQRIKYVLAADNSRYNCKVGS